MTTPIRKFLGLCALGGTSYIAVRYRCDARDVQLYWSTVTRRDDAERNSTTPLPYSSFGMSPEHKRAVDWDEIAPTLQTGDLVFLRGTGSISTKICFISYLWSGLQPEALHFSHVAVVVRRPNPSTSIQVVEMTSKGRGKKWWEYIRLGKNLFTGTPQIVPVTESTCTRGELFLIEAIDNHDVCALDWDGVVRLNQVQVISPQHRIFGKQGSRECYSYCGVRRLRRKGTESHEDVECQRQAVDNFINTYAGRKLDTDPNLLLAHLHPRLYHRFPTMDSSITCSELVAQFYEAMGWTGRGAYESNLLPCEVSKQADPYSWAMDCVQQFRKERQAPITATPWSLGFGTCETLFFHPDCAVAPEDFVIPVRIH